MKIFDYINTAKIPHDKRTINKALKHDRSGENIYIITN